MRLFVNSINVSRLTFHD